jgi:glucosylceramidase
MQGAMVFMGRDSGVRGARGCPLPIGLHITAGANFSMTRTHIGSCDFTVEGKYSYADEPGDEDLSSFSIAPDLAGFDPDEYPCVVDPSYDLLPMIREALEIKRAQGDDLKIVSSAWTAPPWMKDIEKWFIPGEGNAWQDTGGSLKPQYVGLYAEYLARYLEAYRDAGVPIWELTPVNEPQGNGGFWESMHFTPGSQNEFVNVHLGPLMQIRDFGDTKLLVYDQNRDHLEEWTDAIFGDPRSREYVYGVGDPEGFQEEGWFGDDAWWWNRNATDWAYTAEWAPDPENHPMYVPVHRYARDLIVGIDHGMSGWMDWNVVLDRDGGPNHVGNFCGAPIMVDTATKEIHVTPLFHVMVQISRTIRPGDRVLTVERTLATLGDDDLHACATRADDGTISVQLLNTTKEPSRVDLEVDLHVARIEVPPNAVQTVRFAGE